MLEHMDSNSFPAKPHNLELRRSENFYKEALSTKPYSIIPKTSGMKGLGFRVWGLGFRLYVIRGS